MAMRQVVVVPIADLVEQTSTRARGKQAYAKLAERLRSSEPCADVVIIDLSEARMVSGSFLDEFVRSIREMPGGNLEVVFRLSNEEDADRLRRICDIHIVACRYQIGSDGPIVETAPRAVSRVETHEFKGAFFTT
jgi:hypothetical protein